MRVLITGICGFVGSRMARIFREQMADVQITGIDNLSRRGAETNLAVLRGLGCAFVHGDVRNAEDVAELAPADWIVDCAANPSVLAGINGGSGQLVAHNLVGTLNLLEKCRREGAGFLMLSSSRVYSIDALNQIPLERRDGRLAVNPAGAMPAGFSERGVSEEFSTTAPISLYGATKLASEVMALEYGSTFQLPVRVNRCGVIAGAGQFGRIDQGVFSYWIYQWLQRKPLAYIGFGGEGLQVRDFIAPSDLGALLVKQLREPHRPGPRLLNVGGGPARAMSLQELSAYCRGHLGEHQVASAPDNRRFDIPLFVTDSALATRTWDWAPVEPAHQTLDDILAWARANREALATFSL
jgi:CDP-paratose 2-epimerase